MRQLGQGKAARPAAKAMAAWGLLVATFWPASAMSAAENLLVRELTEQGLNLSEQRIKLPAPTLGEGLAAAGQRQALAAVAAGSHEVDDLLRNSVVAPFVLKLGGGKEAGLPETVRTVDAWFVAYGDLDKLATSAFFREFAAGGTAEQPAGQAAAAEQRQETFAARLEEADLRSRSITLLPAAEGREWFIHSGTSLFDRVRIRVTARFVQTQSEGALLGAAVIDPRFRDDRDYPNQWQALERENDDSLKPGPPQTYAGGGLYLKATRLHEPAGALAIEYHLVYEEPRAWFGGANLLRSKLPPLMQDSIRRFRRQALETLKPAPQGSRQGAPLGLQARTALPGTSRSDPRFRTGQTC